MHIFKLFWEDLTVTLNEFLGVVTVCQVVYGIVVG